LIGSLSGRGMVVDIKATRLDSFDYHNALIT
jgi:hypothetical protein